MCLGTPRAHVRRSGKGGGRIWQDAAHVCVPTSSSKAPWLVERAAWKCSLERNGLSSARCTPLSIQFQHCLYNLFGGPAILPRSRTRVEPCTHVDNSGIKVTLLVPRVRRGLPNLVCHFPPFIMEPMCARVRRHRCDLASIYWCVSEHVRSRAAQAV